MRRSFIFILSFTLLSSVLACASSGDGNSAAKGERFRGRLVAMGGPAGGKTNYIDFHADRYASDAEIEAFQKALTDGGDKGLFETMSDAKPIGWVRIGGNTRYHLRLIRSIDTPEGRIIRGITDRPISFAEIIRPTRSKNYSYGIIELSLDPQGEGDGSIIAAAKINFNGHSVEIESLGNQPFRIMAVKPVNLK